MDGIPVPQSVRTQRPPQRFVTDTTVAHPPETVYDWHARPGAFERLTPPWEPLQALGRSGTICEGDSSRIHVHVGPVPIAWTAVHHDLPAGSHPAGTLGFVDEQTHGPFASWHHEHRFVPDGDGTRIEDEVTFRLPMEAVTSPFGALDVQRRLHHVFPYRQARLRIDLGLHARHARLPPRDVHLRGSDPALDPLAAFFSTGGHRVFRDSGIPWYDDAPTATTEDDVIVVAVEHVGQAHEFTFNHPNGTETMLSIPCLIGGAHRDATTPSAWWRRRIRESMERAGAFIHLDDLAAVLLQLMADEAGPRSLGVWLETKPDGSSVPSRDLQQLGLRPLHTHAEVALAFTTGTDPSMYETVDAPR